jgi:dephospho-CoA kinase
MLKVGLTGSIGSGKTIVSRIFNTLGIPVFSADTESKNFLSDPYYRSLIVQRFGDRILDEDGRIINGRLAELVFSDPESLASLNAILHPAVRTALGTWLDRHHDAPYIVHEAAILYESGFYTGFDKIITVTAPVETRIKRVMDRDHVTRNQVVDRMKNQWGDEEKVRRADYIIVNDDNTFVIPQVIRIHIELTELTKIR